MGADFHPRGAGPGAPSRRANADLGVAVSANTARAPFLNESRSDTRRGGSRALSASVGGAAHLDHRGAQEQDRHHLKRVLVRRHCEPPRCDRADHLPSVYPSPRRPPDTGEKKANRTGQPIGSPASERRLRGGGLALPARSGRPAVVEVQGVRARGHAPGRGRRRLPKDPVLLDFLRHRLFGHLLAPG